jgi:hypothetical protein
MLDDPVQHHVVRMLEHGAAQRRVLDDRWQQGGGAIEVQPLEPARTGVGPGDGRGCKNKEQREPDEVTVAAEHWVFE